jgi:hypothetical protein
MSVVLGVFVRIAHNITKEAIYFIEFTTKKLRFSNKMLLNEHLKSFSVKELRGITSRQDGPISKIVK